MLGQRFESLEISPVITNLMFKDISRSCETGRERPMELQKHIYAKLKEKKSGQI